ncbi:hypothetical protein SE958_21580 [Escherichia coli]|nr:hypothetical protein [Escherichia coli]
MTDNISQSFFLRHPGNVTELRIDECIVRKYMESADRIQHSDSAVSVPFIKTTFSHIALLHNVMQNLSLQKTLPQQFSEQMFLPAFPFFHTQRFHVSAIQMHKLCCA